MARKKPRYHSYTLTPTPASRGRLKVSTPFSQQVRQIMENYKGRIDEFEKRFAITFSEELLANTPVRTGLLKGSWRVGYTSGLFAKGIPDPSGSVTLARMTAKINAKQPRHKLYWVNTAPYSRFVEFGTSAFAGRYYITKTMARVKDIAQEVASELRT